MFPSMQYTSKNIWDTLYKNLLLYLIYGHFASLVINFNVEYWVTSLFGPRSVVVNEIEFRSVLSDGTSSHRRLLESFEEMNRLRNVEGPKIPSELIIRIT